jgi:MFS family permease
MIANPAAPGTTRGAVVALAATLALQLFTALAVSAVAVLAPEIARDLAVSPKLIGVFVGIIYAGAAAASLASGGFIARYGAIRVSQAGVLLCAIGLALLPASAGAGAAIPGAYVAAALLLGFGYGPITPASSQVLIRTAPPRQLALTFSIKQTGVPVGIGIAGAVLPGLALAFGWRPSLVAVAAAGLLIAALTQPTRAALDSDRHAGARISVTGIFAPLALVFADRALTRLALTGFAYAATQVCLLSFLVVYLTEEMGHSLIAAGFALTVANVGGIVGRILWGAVADRFIHPRTLLATIGLGTALCSYVLAGFAAAWPMAALLVVCALYGATAIGWNGVQLAQVARLSPSGKAGIVTGAAGFVTFSGVVVGPPSFALLAGIAGGYRAGFVTFGTVALACALWLLRRNRESR